MSIYTDLVAAGVPVENHRSDLYAKVTPESRAILATYEHRRSVTVFVSQIDREPWYDIPFAFDPFWERRAPIFRILSDEKIAEQDRRV